MDILPNYANVWLFDEDILIKKQFDVNFLLHAMSCAFYPRIAPLIIQPVLSGNVSYSHLGDKIWKQSNILVSATDFIEIQT